MQEQVHTPAAAPDRPAPPTGQPAQRQIPGEPPFGHPPAGEEAESWMLPFLAFVIGAALLLASHVMEANNVAPRWMTTLMKEIGFAALVALAVWLFFELHTRKRQERRINARIEQITLNVFHGVFRRDLPKELVDEATSLIFENRLMRTNFQVHYTLGDASYNRDGKDHDCISLRAMSNFTLTNVSPEPVDVNLGIGMPNPISPELRDLCDVVGIKVRYRGENQDLAIEEQRTKMREAMKNTKSNTITVSAGKRTLLKGESMDVTAEYVMAKEAEDTEILQSYFPSAGLRLTVIDQKPGKRVVRAKSLHRDELYEMGDGAKTGIYHFALNKPILPHQGAAVWWKLARPAVAAAVAAEAAPDAAEPAAAVTPVTSKLTEPKVS